MKHIDLEKLLYACTLKETQNISMLHILPNSFLRKQKKDL